MPKDNIINMYQNIINALEKEIYEKRQELDQTLTTLAEYRRKIYMMEELKNE